MLSLVAVVSASGEVCFFEFFWRSYRHWRVPDTLLWDGASWSLGVMPGRSHPQVWHHNKKYVNWRHAFHFTWFSLTFSPVTLLSRELTKVRRQLSLIRSYRDFSFAYRRSARNDCNFYSPSCLTCFWHFVFWLIWPWRTAWTRPMLFAFLVSHSSALVSHYSAFILEPLFIVISIHRSQGKDEYGLPVIHWARS